MRRITLACVLVLTAACSHSPSAPSEGATTSGMLEGQAISALDGSAGSGVSVRVGDSRAVVTDAAGAFQVDVGAAGTYTAALHGGAFVDRETSVAAPGSRARLSLIPATFDLEAFDQMYRTSHGQLQRWVSQPRLVLVATVMNYHGANGDEYPATRDQMTDDEVSLMLAHLTEGLTMLTGGTYSSFASVEIERPAADARVSFARDGKIVVGRFNNIVLFASTIGYGSWSERTDGSIAGGALFLDNDFDRTDARRRLLRIHELGHALGYQHVTSRPSIMNPAIGPEPSDVDRAGAIIAFQRPPGNKSPDIDPPSSAARTSSTTGGGGRWVTVYCR
jgi:matrixin